MFADLRIQNVFYKKFLFLFLASILFIFYIYVASNTYGYDDEFNTIKIIESLDFRNMYRYLQSSDIHPPLSYLINKLLFNILKDWNLVRAVLSSFVVLSIINLAYSRYKINKNSSILLLLFLGFDPNIIMWGTSIRWYTYFIIILNWYLIIPNRNSIWFYLKQIIGLILLGYTGYIFILLIPPLFIYYNCSPLKAFKGNFSKILITYASFIFLYSYQFFIFVTVHLQTKAAGGNYGFPLKKIFIGIISGVFSNQGVMPFSYAGIISIISFAFILFCIFKKSMKEKQLFDLFQVYILAIATFIFSGVLGFVRILVILIPFKALLLSSFEIKKLSYQLACIILILSQLQGFSNVISHSGTTKAYWNIPHKEIFRELEVQSKSCPKDLVVVHHDQAMSFHLNKKQYISISPFENSFPYVSGKDILNESPFKNKNDLDQIFNSKNINCVAVVDTFRGINGIPYEQKIKLLNAVENLNYKSLKSFNFGKNNDVRLNRIFTKDYPEYRANIRLFKDVSNISELRVWENLLQSP